MGVRRCGIPPKDYDLLQKAGVSAIHRPGTDIPHAATEILSLTQKQRLAHEVRSRSALIANRIRSED